MSQVNYNYNNVTSLLQKNKQVHFSEQCVPIVIRAHGNLMVNSYTEVPKNFLVVTFVTDGRPVCDIEGISVQGHTTRCKSKMAKYVYIWNRFLLNVAELAQTNSGSGFIDKMKENMPRLNADLQAYRDEFRIPIDMNIEYTTVYYPGDLICNTSYMYHNDKDYRMGVTSWDEFLRQKNRLFEPGLPTLDFEAAHPLAGMHRTLDPQNSGVMFLHNIMDYMVHTIPEDTVKVVFAFSCRTVTDPFGYGLLRVKPEHSYLYKNLFGHLHHIEHRLSAQKRTLNHARLEQRAAQMTNSAEAMYHKLCFGSLMNFASKIKKLQSNSYCVYFDDVSDENLKNERTQNGRLIGMHVPVRATLGARVSFDAANTHNDTDATFYLPPNVVGHVIWSSFQPGGIMLSYTSDVMWNTAAREQIFQRWAAMTYHKFYVNVRDDFHAVMYDIFVRKMQPGDIMDKFVDNLGAQALIKGYDTNYLFLPYFNVPLVKYYLLPEFHDEFIRGYKSKSLVRRTFAYLTPVEYAVANYLYLNEDGNSVIRSEIGRGNNAQSNKIAHIDAIVEQYRAERRFPDINFYGEYKLCARVYQNVFVNIEKFMKINSMYDTSLYDVFIEYNKQFVRAFYARNLGNYKVKLYNGTEIMALGYVLDNEVEGHLNKYSNVVNATRGAART